MPLCTTKPLPIAFASSISVASSLRSSFCVDCLTETWVIRIINATFGVIATGCHWCLRLLRRCLRFLLIFFGTRSFHFDRSYTCIWDTLCPTPATREQEMPLCTTKPLPIAFASSISVASSLRSSFCVDCLTETWVIRIVNATFGVIATGCHWCLRFLLIFFGTRSFHFNRSYRCIWEASSPNSPTREQEMPFCTTLPLPIAFASSISIASRLRCSFCVEWVTQTNVIRIINATFGVVAAYWLLAWSGAQLQQT